MAWHCPKCKKTIMREPVKANMTPKGFYRSVCTASGEVDVLLRPIPRNKNAKKR